MKLPQSFVSSLESAIEKRHKQGHSFHLGGPADEEGLIDFGSNDTLSIRRSDIFRREILHELESFQGFAIGAGSSRILHGSSEHVAKLEQLMADHYGCEDALLFNSGFEANLAIFSSLPQPGDIIIHDSLIHASIRDGIKNGRASIVRDFAHNDAESFRASLESVKSYYSMDGGTSPVREILAHAKEGLPAGNYVLVIDEAHSNGLLGPGGSGYIRHLGLEKEQIIQMQSFGKAPASTGGSVLCSSLVKLFMANYCRGFIFSTGPSFPTVATIRASINILRSAEGERRRKLLRTKIELAHQLILQHPKRELVVKSGILKFPSVEQQNELTFYVPIIPIVTAPGKCEKLQERLREHAYCTNAVQHPIVPRTEERIRFMMHAENTIDEIQGFIDVFFSWACESIATIT